MAGVTDRPFRQLCRSLGAHLATSEMVTPVASLRDSRKTQQRLNHDGESGPRIVQIAGADPEMMADAARYSVDNGAQVIDINMGCPAKKVCNVLAGSALLRDESLVGRILDAVAGAVEVPVSLKIRTGWDLEHVNGVRVARIAESAGVSALTVHGRTRACGYRGRVDYLAIRDIKRAVAIPVLANGDIDSAAKAAQVLAATGADGVVIGRAALGNPWIFTQARAWLRGGQLPPAPSAREVGNAVTDHLRQLYGFYGERDGVRIARKHIQWYCSNRPAGREFWRRVNRVENAGQQLQMTSDYFDELITGEEELAA